MPTPQVALSQEPITITLNSTADLTENSAQYGQAQQALIDQVRREFTVRGATRAGMVETFGYGRSTDGNRIAEAVNRALMSGDDVLFKQAIFRNYHDLSGSPIGGAQILIYVYIDNH
jgi:hypothetical protein